MRVGFVVGTEARVESIRLQREMDEKGGRGSQACVNYQCAGFFLIRDRVQDHLSAGLRPFPLLVSIFRDLVRIFVLASLWLLEKDYRSSQGAADDL